jgi:hypothetical protein
VCNFADPKNPSFGPKPACFDFSSFNFYCADHIIVSTATGDALYSFEIHFFAAGNIY